MINIDNFYQQLHHSFDGIVETSMGHKFLHDWMHHQVVSIFFRKETPTSYGAFLAAAVAQGELNLDHPGYEHTSIYLSSCVDQDGQIPPEYFRALAIQVSFHSKAYL